MVFPLSDDLFIGNGHFRLKHKKSAPKSVKFIKNRCTHCGVRLVSTGKYAHLKGIAIDSPIALKYCSVGTPLQSVQLMTDVVRDLLAIASLSDVLV